MNPSNRSRTCFCIGVLFAFAALLILVVPAYASIGPGGKNYLPNLQRHNEPTATNTSRPTATYDPTATLTPKPSATPDPTATNTPISNEVNVLPEWNYYVDRVGDLHIIGEIENNTSKNTVFTKVSASIFDGEGTILATDHTYAYLDLIQPGEVTCFELLLGEPSGWQTIEFESPTYYTTQNDRPLLTITNRNAEHDDYWGWNKIVGQIRNDDDSTLEYVKAIGTGYDASGKIADCDFTFVNADTLASGETSAFEMTLRGDLIDGIENYKLQTNGSILN